MGTAQHRPTGIAVVAALAVGLLALAGCTGSAAPTASAPPTQSPVPAPTAAQVGVPVPSTGFYWGGTSNSDQATVPGCAKQTGSDGARYSELECKIGWAARRLGTAVPAAAAGTGSDVDTTMARAYLNGDNGCEKDVDRVRPGGDIYQLASAPGRKVLLLSTKCGPWPVLASGGGKSPADGYVRTLVDALVQLPVPVILVFHHEPENDACGQGSGDGTPDDYRAAYRQFAADVRGEETTKHKDRIALGWILMGQTLSQWSAGDRATFTTCQSFRANDTATDNPLRNPENWYPGDDVVDWVGADVYSHGTSTPLSTAVRPFVAWSHAACPAQHPAHNWSCTAARATKPLMLGEFGPGLGQFPPTQTQKAAWIDRIRTDIVSGRTDLSQLKALAYWSSGEQNAIDMPPSAGHPALLAYARLSLLPQASTPTFAG